MGDKIDAFIIERDDKSFSTQKQLFLLIEGFFLKGAVRQIVICKAFS